MKSKGRKGNQTDHQTCLAYDNPEAFYFILFCKEFLLALHQASIEINFPCSFTHQDDKRFPLASLYYHPQQLEKLLSPFQVLFYKRED